MKDLGKKIHGTLILLLLGIVALQTIHPFAPNGSLSGAVIASEQVPLTINTVLDGSLMKAVDTHCAAHLGFKPAMARTNNQINYSLFNYIRPTNSNLIQEKDGWLYEGHYLYSRIQKSKLTDEETETFASGLKTIQDFLQSKGADIYFIISPSKATIYPEFTPPHFQDVFAAANHTSTYQKFVSAFEDHGVNLIDGPQWFLNKKAQAPDYLLFSRGGTHWGEFAAFEFLRDALTQINQSPFIEIPPMNLSKSERHLSKGYDNDIAALLNIWNQDGTKDLMPYPIFEKHPTHTTPRPVTQVYGDSFSWITNRHLVQSNVIPHLDMHYYNAYSVEYNGELETRVPLKELDMKELGKPGQLILITCNEASLYLRWMWDVVDKALVSINQI